MNVYVIRYTRLTVYTWCISLPFLQKSLSLMEHISTKTNEKYILLLK